MTKKSAIAKITLIAVFALIGILLSTICFNIPFSNSKWNSFIGGINFGNDVSSGIEASYDFELIDSSKDLETASSSARENIIKTLNDYYSEPTVCLVGDDKLIIDIGNIEDSADDNRVENVLSQIGGENSFKVYDEDETQEISLSQIKSLAYQKIAGTETLVIEFNKAGAKVLKSLSENCYNTNTNLIIKFSEENKIESVPSEVIEDGKLYISGGVTKASCVATIINLECEKASVQLTFDKTTSISSKVANNFAVAVLIILFAVLVVCLILISIRFRIFGVVALCSSLIFISIYSLFLNILPNMQITGGGLAGIVVALMIMIFSNVFLFNQTLIENQNGKKIKSAFDFAYSKTLKTILDFSAVLFIPFFILIFVGTSSINNFAVSLCVGLLVNLFTTLLISKDCSKSLIKLLNKKPKAFNMKKEVLKDENV